MAANGIGAQANLARSSYAPRKLAAKRQKPAADTFQRSPTTPTHNDGLTSEVPNRGQQIRHRLAHGFAQVCLGILTVCLWPLSKLQEGLLWLAGREPTVQTQRRALATAAAQGNAAQAQLATLQARVRHLQQQEAELQGRVTPARQNLQTLQEQTQSQQGKLDVLTQHAQRIRRQAAQAQGQLQAAQVEHQALGASTGALRQEAQGLQQTLDLTQSQLSQAETDLLSKQPLLREIDALRGILDKSQSGLRNVQAKRSTAQQSVQNLHAQGKYCEDKRDRLQIECDHLRASKQTLQDKIAALQAQHNTLTGQVAATKQDEQPLLQRVQMLRAQQTSLQEANNSLQSTNNTLRGVNHTLRGMHATLQTTNAALRQTNGALHAELSQFSTLYADQMHTMRQAMQQFAVSVAHLNAGVPSPFAQSMFAMTQVWQANLQEISTRMQILGGALHALADAREDPAQVGAHARLERASLTDTNAQAIQAANTLAPVVLGLKMFRLKQMNADTLQKLMGRLSPQTLASLEKALFGEDADNSGYFKKPADQRVRADRVMLRTVITALTQGLDTDSETLRNWQFEHKNLKKELRQASLNLHCDHYNTLCNASPAFKDKLTQLSRLFFAVNEQLADDVLDALKNGAVD